MSIFKLPRISYPVTELDVKGINDMFKNISYLLGGNVDFINLSDKVNSVIEGKANYTDLENYVTDTALNTALQDKVATGDLTQALMNYITSGTFSNTLANYVTSANLTTKLGEDYIITGKILANQIASGQITGATIKTANATNYINIQNEYVESYLNSTKVWKIGAIHYDMQGTSRDAALFEFHTYGDCYMIYDNVDKLANHGEWNIVNGLSSIWLYGSGRIELDGSNGGVHILPQNYSGEGGEINLVGSGGGSDIRIDNLNGKFRVHDGTNVGLEINPASEIIAQRQITINPNNSGSTGLRINQGGDFYITSQVSGLDTNIYNDSGQLNFSTAIGSPAFNNTSDRNLKTDIKSFDSGYAYDLVKNLKFYNYKYDKSKFKETRGIKVDPDHIHTGIMADEAPKEFLAEGDEKGINLYAMLTATAAAVQELIKRTEGKNGKTI